MPSRQLNISGIKKTVMFFVAVLLSALSSITGIGGAFAMAPAIEFLLGMKPQRIAGLSIFFGLCTAVGGVVGASAVGIKVNALHILLVMIGATVAAVPGARIAAAISHPNAVRVVHSALTIGYLWCVVDAVQPNSKLLSHAAYGNSALTPFLIGVAAGLLSRAFEITIAALIVPGLLYFGGWPAAVAITMSVAVTLLASLLPTLGYSSRQLIDPEMSRPVGFGGFLGGLAGGSLLAPLASLGSKFLVIPFAVYAMFLSAYVIRHALSISTQDPTTQV
jgi:uncharacterized membrane protein YfcA